MTYLEEFQNQINNRDYAKFLLLWEEYCTNDVVDVPEFLSFLQMVKQSDFSINFGKIVDTALPLWELIADEKQSYEVMKHLIDLQNTNTPLLAEITHKLIKNRFGNDPKYQDKLRLVGLRNNDNFQGALTNFELLMHMKKGNFVFNASGLGTGEIMDISEVREQLAIEFENSSGIKQITFTNAFKTLVPLERSHFLARRFADPDKLEAEAREQPIEIIKALLRDLGPKTAAEIKDELIDLVIPEKDWAKWWSNTRSRLKKDELIESPDSQKEPFKLRENAWSAEERLSKSLQPKTGGIDEQLQSAYSFVRDFPAMLKQGDAKASLISKVTGVLSSEELTQPQEFQALLLLETMLDTKIAGKSINEMVRRAKDLDAIVQGVDILAFKKQLLVAIKENREDWIPLFLSLLDSLPQANLKDYVLKELSTGPAKSNLDKHLEALAENPVSNPELFVWYFSKLTSDADTDDLPFASKKGVCKLFESYLILYSALENKPEFKDLSKKMYQLLSGKRFAVVRQVIQDTDVDYLKEILLLASKCPSLSDHDLKTLRSLAAVVQPSLRHESDKKKESHLDANIHWTTDTGYRRIQERCHQIGTVEIVENAREVEAARALGDLRENSEYKFACERRSRLQGELKALSEQLKRARIILPQDVHTSEVGIGSVVTLADSADKKTTYTILGAWDADAENKVLSIQSKLAQAMLGAKVGDTVLFKDEEFTVTAITSYFAEQKR